MDYAGARREAIARAQQYLAQEPVYLDTETTGVRSNAEIIEISIIDHTGAPLFDSLVRPAIPSRSMPPIFTISPMPWLLTHPLGM
ncbi:MAG: hypothetical protein R2932_05265 [Caldilineaceae bacterium]